MIPLRRRVRRWVCGRRGHLPGQSVADVRDGLFLRAVICPRCTHIFSYEVGPRRDRRRQWRDRAG